MSSFGLEGAPYLFSQTGTFPAPYTFTVPATLEVRTDMASASFDGSGASGSWLPAVSFYSPSGVRLGTFPCQGSPLAPGDTAEVTWFPLGLAASSGGGTGSGIQFDTKPQAGGWLYVEADTAAPAAPHSSIELFAAATANGIYIHEASTNGIILAADGVVPGVIGGGGVQLFASGGGIGAFSVASVDIESSHNDVSLDAGNDVNIQAAEFTTGDINLTQTAHAGNITIGGSATGRTTLRFSNDLLLVGVPTADPVVTNAIWADGGVLVQSGHTVPGGSGIAFDTANSGGYLSVQVTAGDVTFELASGQVLNVKDDGGNPLMTVHNDGDYKFNVGSSQAFTVYDSTGNVVFAALEQGSAFVAVASGQAFEVDDQLGTTRFLVDDVGTVRMPSLPTSDPGTSDGALWVDALNFVRYST